jgi:hypothetical protein
MFTPPLSGAPAVTNIDVPNAPSMDQVATGVSPDQQSAVQDIAQNAQAQAVPATKGGSKWARVAQGALAGFLEGGIPGAVGGAIDPGQAQQIKQQQILNRDAQMQRTRLAMNSAVQDAQVHAQDNNVQMAQAALNLRHISALANGQLPPEFRSQLTVEGASAAQHLIDSGIPPVFKGDQADAMYHQLARQSVNTDNPIGVITLPMADGSFGVFEVPNNDRAYTHAVDLTIGYDANGKPVTKHFEPGQISIARGLALETAAVVDQAKAQSKIALANATGVTNKNNAAANKANVAASGTGSTKAENLLVGSLPDGSQVAGTQRELQAAGASGITKLPTTEGAKVVVARQLIAPNGLFASVAQDIHELDAKGKLGVAASRWNDFLAGKVGDEPDFVKLRTDMGLLGTALMQAHVGARGSHEMLEHFKSLADYRISDATTLGAALGREYSYVTEKAMLPKARK